MADEEETPLARIGRRAFQRVLGAGARFPGVTDARATADARAQDIAAAQAQGLAANQAYMMQAPVWERDAWVQGAARRAQEADLAAIADEMAATRGSIGRATSSLNPTEAIQAAMAKARADAAAFAPVEQPGPSPADSLRVASGGYGEALTGRREFDTGDSIGLPIPDDIVAEAAARRSLAESAREFDADAAGTIGRRIPRLQDKLAGQGQEQMVAAADLNQYARLAAPALGVDPLLAAGLYASDPGDIMAAQAGLGKYQNYLETGDPSGRSALDVQLDQYRDQRDLTAMEDDLTGNEYAELNISAMADTLGENPAEFMQIPETQLRRAAADPYWADYQVAVEDLVDGGATGLSWTEVRGELDAMGLPKPTGAVNSALAAYYRSLLGG